MSSPSILKVNLEAKQNFDGLSQSKIVVPFEREEDMILLCLSIFLHDFVHDYNLSSMHKRVIKGDAYAIMQSLNIGINNPTFKIYTYNVGGYGDVSLYDDSKFQNIPVPPSSRFAAYENYFRENNLEKSIQTGGGLAIAKGRSGVTSLSGAEELGTEATQLVAPEEKDKEFLEDTSVADEDILIYPIESDFTSKDTYNTLIEHFQGDANFLGLHSGFNTFIVTYLGSNIGSPTPEFLERMNAGAKIEPKSIEMHNLAMFNSILASIDCITADFKKQSLDGSKISTEYDCFGDMFIVLRYAFVTIFNMKNRDLTIDALDILKSSDVLRQFIVFYVLFLNVESIDAFILVLEKQTMAKEGGGGGEEEYGSAATGEKATAAAGEEEEDDEENIPKEGYVLGRQGETEEERDYGKGMQLYYRGLEKKRIFGTESIFITHNNLLTTLARGMFIKLGLWQKIFSNRASSSSSSSSVSYIFGKEEIDFISLQELEKSFPIGRGTFNNELLIMQILILKNLMFEMTPAKTMTFGAKIDDQLKNYLDVFYYSYFVNKKQRTSNPETSVEDEVVDNPDLPIDINKSDVDSLVPSSGAEDASNDEDSQEEDHLDSDPELEGGGKVNQLNERVIPPAPQLIPPAPQLIPPAPQLVIPPPPAPQLKVPPTPAPQLKIPPPPAPQLVIPPPPLPAAQEASASSPSVPVMVSEIVDPGRPPSMPIIFKNLKKMYQNNIYTIQNLKQSAIPPITFQFNGESVTISNLYDLLSFNQTLMHRTDSVFNIPAPALKFIINNAANIAANINGSRFLYTKKDKAVMDLIVHEIREILKTIGNFVVALVRLDEDFSRITAEMVPLIERERTLKVLKQINKITINEYNELLQIQFDIKRLRNTELIPLENKKYLMHKITELNKHGLLSGNAWFADWDRNYTTWFNESQSFFGLYRNLVRGTFCPTASMMDAMFNCSLKLGASEPKEVGTMHFELVYGSRESGRMISYGGVVLNYNQTIGDVEQLIAKIDFDLVCIDTAHGVNDIANISTMGIPVAESHDLKASVVYASVVERIKRIYASSFGIDTEADIPLSDDPAIIKQFLNEKVSRMWDNMQYYKNLDNFNTLLGGTAIKTFGDFLQEVLGCIQWGGYINSPDSFPENVKSFIGEQEIAPIYRSVSQTGTIVPYDQDGNALRLGIQGDRPSGFRSIYILLNGISGINQQAIGGYVYTMPNQRASRSILVSRNSQDDTNNNKRPDGLQGKVIYTTRELQIIQENRKQYLKSLQFKKLATKKLLIDKETGKEFEPEVSGANIEGSTYTKYTMMAPTSDVLSIEGPYKPSDYSEWDDYEKPRVIKKIEKDIPDLPTRKEPVKKEVVLTPEEEREKMMKSLGKQLKVAITTKQKKQQMENEKRSRKEKYDLLKARYDENPSSLSRTELRQYNEFHEEFGEEATASASGTSSELGGSSKTKKQAKKCVTSNKTSRRKYRKMKNKRTLKHSKGKTIKKHKFTRKLNSN